jgi:hypothetical protein
MEDSLMKTQLRNDPTATIRAALAVCACAAILWWTGNAHAENVAAPPAATTAERHLANLEHVFWLCDYIAAKHGVAEAPMELCTDVTHELMDAKFGADFERMVEWWRRNKEEAHERLAGEGAACRAPAQEADWI